MSETPENKSLHLTAKELLVLRLVADGKTSEEISKELCLSLPTVKWYRKKLRTKLNASTSVQMIRKAVALHLI